MTLSAKDLKRSHCVYEGLAEMLCDGLHWENETAEPGDAEHRKHVVDLIHWQAEEIADLLIANSMFTTPDSGEEK